MKLLITGASGFLGQHVVAEALCSGHAVRAAVRPAFDTSAPFEQRLPRFVADRSQLRETITPVRRAALIEAPFSPAVTTRLRAFQKIKREQVLQVFDAELSRIESKMRTTVAAATCAAASWSTWEELRANQRMSAAAARRSLGHTLETLLRPYARAPGGQT